VILFLRLAALTLAITGSPEPPPPDAPFDYQLGGDYEPAAGVRVVSRDWFSGQPLDAGGGFSICYINAFQTQPDEAYVDRPDERSNWPAGLVLTDLGDDPGWAGEYVIDIGTAAQRSRAFEHVVPMIDACTAKGFDAVEFDNLDSWTRFDVQFGRDESVAYAELLTDYAHSLGLAVGQKNTPELGAEISLDVIGFDYAVAEECGTYGECTDYTEVFGDGVFVIEYSVDGFVEACAAVGDRVSVVLRDVDLTTPGSESYVYDSC
jgi:hypothetical protein